ncbi:diacylglyceryl transferase [Pedobacter yulinensis]|uniref:Diacylglyceryl transferase n=1 Tax=Pedobacter yulinensis TaxID=2126353 RepID=A0A2T3HPM0_9SPHI|nr:prolipoprotein diacylglyceryl transferase family protein [Pedobacter yulinensis]PST84376.1 diacylglyceryl transferase [Pedobacter yulinensis]
MNFPIAFDINGHTLYLHAIAEWLAFFAGFRYYLLLRRREGDQIDSENRIWIIIGCMFGALIGSRLLGALENYPEMLASRQRLLYFFTNKTIVGGLLGGLFGVELTKKIVGETRRSGDLFVFPIILALIIGRLGCFSMGLAEQTHGLPASLPWAIDLGDGIPRHPVSLYEILFLCLLWLYLIWLKQDRLPAPGGLFRFFMIAYLVFRFTLDFIKPHFSWDTGLSTIQMACIAGLVWYAIDRAQPAGKFINNNQHLPDA